MTSLRRCTLVALALPSFAAAQAVAPRSPEPFRKTVSAAHLNAVLVDVDDGATELRGWDVDSVSVAVTSDPARCRADVDTRIGATELAVRVRRGAAARGVSACPTHVVVRLPRRMRAEAFVLQGALAVDGVLGGVGARVQRGSVELRQVRGAVRLFVFTGDVMLANCDLSGTVRAVNGAVTRRDVSGNVRIASAADRKRR